MGHKRHLELIWYSETDNVVYPIYSFIKAFCSDPQYDERILNKIENTFNRTFVGWMSKILRGSVFFQKSYMHCHEIHQLGSFANFAWLRLIWLSCQACEFYGHTSRISSIIYFEPLMDTLSPCKDPIESIFNFI